jgi:glycosyl transferase family 2
MAQPEASDPLVAVPVRGSAGLDGFLAALAAQDYPAWSVVFTVEDRADPAFAALSRFAAAHPARFEAVVAAGATTARAQKVHNLLAALPWLRPDDAALVTLDADTLPPPDLLAELLRPILTGQGDLSSGYRWTLPAAGGTGPLLLSLAEMGVATLPRSAGLNLCWGGATAIGRSALERLDLPRLWDRAVSDDLSVSRAAHRAGLVIYAPLTARPPSPAEAGVAGALRFGARQHRLLRLHSPGRWLLAGFVLACPWRAAPRRWSRRRAAATPPSPAWQRRGCCNARAPFCAAPSPAASCSPTPRRRRRARCAGDGGGSRSRTRCTRSPGWKARSAGAWTGPDGATGSRHVGRCWR